MTNSCNWSKFNPSVPLSPLSYLPYLGVEASGAIIAPLDDVPGNARNSQASTAWHKDLLVLDKLTVKIIRVNREPETVVCP